MGINRKNVKEEAYVRFSTADTSDGGIRLDGIEFSDDASTAVGRGEQTPVRDTVCIPDGVTVVRRAAHPRITAIAIPHTVRRIGQEAFTVFANHYTADGYYPMDDDPMGNGHHLNLRTVIFSEGLTEIDAWAFFKMKAISGIKLPKGLKSIGTEAFSGCEGITQLVIPASVERLEDGAFESCTGLRKVIFNRGVTELPSNLFYNDSALAEIGLPDTLKQIGDRCFCHCTALSEIDIPDSVEEIGRDAFYNCSALTSIGFKRDVKSGTDVFERCTALTRFVVGKGVRAPEALPYAPFVSSVEVAGDHSDFVTVDGAVYTRDKKTLVRVPFGIVGGFTVPRGVTAIGNGAFSQCRRITSVTLPSSLERIGDDAFFGCSQLEEVTMGGKVRVIGKYAFARCVALKSLHISASVTEIGNDILFGNGDINVTVSPANPFYAVNNGVLVKK